MADKLALEHIFDTIKARFAVEVPACGLFFGWRAATEQISTFPRIVFTPGQEGALGEFLPARDPGQNPRPLATLGELVTVEISAMDEAEPSSEIAQYRVTRFLMDDFFRALYHAARGTFVIVSGRWKHDKKQAGAGACIQLVIAMQAKLPDAVQTTTTTPATAELEAELLDQTETLTAGGPQEE